MEPGEKQEESGVPEGPRTLDPRLHTLGTSPTSPPGTTSTSTSSPNSPASTSPSKSTPAPKSTALSWLKRQIKGPGRRKPTTHMTAAQAGYIFGFHGLGAMVISGGVNFGIACAMYLSPKDPIALLALPNSLAGDAALTIAVQTIVTWLIEWALVSSDLSSGKVAPLAWSYSSSPRIRRVLGVPCIGNVEAGLGGERQGEVEGEGEREARSPGNEAQDTSTQKGARERKRTPLPLPSHIPRILSLLLPSFILFWPPSLAVLTAVGTRSGGDYIFPSRWAPQVFKLVLGGVLGLVSTPFMAMFWVMREGVA